MTIVARICVWPIQGLVSDRREIVATHKKRIVVPTHSSNVYIII